MKHYDVAALGELLIDFTSGGLSAQGNPMMEANPGGAPCNVLAMLCKQGFSTAFLGKVGKDGFGQQLKQALVEVGIETKGLREDPKVHTTLAVVHTLPGGDRDFSFYRNPGADMMLTPQEVDEEIVKNSTIFHYGSLSMTDDPCRSATQDAVAMAEKAGALLSFDPNLRPPLWQSLGDAKEAITWGMKHCSILKISDNEITWFTGLADYDEGVRYLQETYHIPLILLSLGPDGSRAYMNDLRVEVPAFHLDATIETTGAGDTFMGAMLGGILERGWRDYTQEELSQMLTFANAAAALVTTKKGALRVMPEKADIETLLGR